MDEPFKAHDAEPRDVSILGRALNRVGWRLRLLLWRLRRRHQYQDERWDPMEITPDVLTPVRVEELPAPHHLFKCRYADRSRNLIERHEHDPGQAGREFLATLTDEEAALCQYHQADWKRIAALSVAVLARMQEGQRRDKALRVIARRYGLNHRDELELMFLFADPIHWGFGTDELQNGQHRVCALKKASVEFCVVER